MALIQDSERMTYVTIFDGKFEVKVKEGTPNSVSRKNKNDETIHVLLYRGVSGIITDLKKEVTTHKGSTFSSLKILLDDNGEKMALSLPYDSGLTSAFFHMMENIDFTKTVEFSASKDKEKDKTSLFLSQDGKNIKWKYTLAWSKENPTLPQKPQWEQKMFKGKLQWDNTEETMFFENIVKTKIVPKLIGRKPQHPTDTPANAHHPAESLVNDDSWIPSAPPPEMVDANEQPSDDTPF
jgi:hypothetical protein